MAAAKLWTPEQPNLHVLETGTGGDSASTRFGMREFHFETATKRAYLNGRPYFMRGSNITLHRFFEDPKSGVLPWDDKWVRKLLIDIPKEMHWNSFRFCIGPVPDKWFDIADEAGLLIQNEYFVWTGKGWHGAENQVRFDAGEMIREYGEWMRDNWNHPSVAIWDANNETFDPIFGEKIIPAVRGLDLSNRPWENSYNPPVGPDDPVEDHPYEFSAMARRGGPEFSMTTFERPNGKAPGAPTGHALILNEYGWTWLNRDGSPTELTKDLYPRLLPANATAEDRFALNAYLLGGITEFWRAYRQYAAVLHFVYLMSSDPLGYTADHFRDVEKLELEPHFRDYMSQAFAPLGVYLSFWQPKLPAGKQTFQVMLVNDEYQRSRGQRDGIAPIQERRRSGARADAFPGRQPGTDHTLHRSRRAEHAGRLPPAGQSRWGQGKAHTEPAQSYRHGSGRKVIGHSVEGLPTDDRGSSLARFEAHFNLGSHLDGVAALDRGLETKLRPLHSLTELRAGFERRDFPFRVDDDFATNRSPRGLPKGCGLNGRTLNQRSLLFIRSNRDFGDIRIVGRGLFLRVRGSGCSPRR